MTKCSENLACSEYRDTFQVEQPVFESLTYQFDLYCEREWYKAIILNIKSFVGPFFVCVFLFLADKYGRKTILTVMIPIGLICISLCLMFKNLVIVTIGMTAVEMMHGSLLSLCFIFLNELFIDPLRSKSSGLKTFSMSLGAMSNFLFWWVKVILSGDLIIVRG